MSATVKEKIKQQNKFDNITKMAMVLLPIFMLVVFIEPKTSIFCGPVLAVLLTYLFLFGKEELATAVIIIANDALGTVILGVFSFQYLLILLICIKLPFNKLSRKRFIYLVVCLAFLIQLLLAQTINFRGLIVTLSYVLGISYINFEDEDRAKKFFQAVAFSVIVIAIHAMVTGGVDYSETEPGSIEEVRKGLLGVGNSNANFSSFLLNIGIICLWNFFDFKKIFKVILTMPMIYSIVITRSTMGLIGLLLIVVMSILLGKNKLKSFTILIATIIGLVVLYSIYQSLPEHLHVLEIDLYIERMQEKIEQLLVGDYRSATTGRSDIVSKYLKYILVDQSAFRMLFGGNPQIVESVSLYVPHNTYITIILQFGLVGVVIFTLCAIKRFATTIKVKEALYRKAYIVLKSLCLVVAFSTSLFGNNLWVLWMMSLFIL